MNVISVVSRMWVIKNWFSVNEDDFGELRSYIYIHTYIYIYIYIYIHIYLYYSCNL